MDAESARQLLIAYIDGQLDPDTVGEIDQCLENDPALRREVAQLRELTSLLEKGEVLEPDAWMRTRFNSFLEKEQSRKSSSATFLGFGWLQPFSPVVRVAAAVAVVAVGAIVFWFGANRGPASGHKEIAPVAQSFAYYPDDGLASGRLQWISQADGAAQAEPEFLEALLEILAQDQNGAVRLAALKALGDFNDDPVVRQRLIKMLPEETDPMMQVALIEILSKTGTPEARESIEQLLLRRDVRGFVKGQAQLGLTYH
jgi:hypothetical protein